MNRRTFIKKTGGAGLLFGLGGFSIISIGCRQTYDFDLILKGGHVLDGTGKAGFNSDIGIKNKKITALGDLQNFSAYRILDVAELTVTPGFIDVHSHSADELLVNPKAESKIRQGVTTEILGQDGSSMAPLTHEMQAEMSERFQDRFGFGVDWLDFEGYFRRIRQTGTAVNVATMVGQGRLRECVLGMSDRAATRAEIQEMQELAHLALKQGALGISSGLEYTPGAFASTDEIIELCKVMQGTSGLYATHMRNEDDRVLAAVEEAIAIARGAGVGLQISHLKCQGQRNWDKLDAIFSSIAKANSQRLMVTMDRYPYVAYSTGLASLLPIWCREGGTEKFIARLQNPALLSKIKSETLDKVSMLGSWKSVMLTSVGLEKNRPLQGKTVAELVKGSGQDPFEYVRELIIEEKNRVSMVGFGMSEENTARILAHPLCMIASDGSAKAPYGPLSKSKPHPRSYGTFPRILSKYVREENLFSLPEAIRKMTNLPAIRFGLNKRGQIAKDFMADLVIFDHDKVKDKATFSNPHQYPEGIEYVLVNGKIVIEKEEHTRKLPGLVLTKTP
ncbi:MAG: amidohydrolase family protein [bacterium]